MRLHVVEDDAVELSGTSDRNTAIGDRRGGNRPEIIVPTVLPYVINKTKTRLVQPL